MEKEYINEVYFQNIKDDLIVNFINVVKDNKYEKISYFIKEDKEIGNYIHYENQKDLNINFKLNSSRGIQRKKKKNDDAINQNIVDYLGKGLYSYRKLIE